MAGTRSTGTTAPHEPSPTAYLPDTPLPGSRPPAPTPSSTPSATLSLGSHGDAWVVAKPGVESQGQGVDRSDSHGAAQPETHPPTPEPAPHWHPGSPVVDVVTWLCATTFLGDQVCVHASAVVRACVCASLLQLVHLPLPLS